MNSNSKYAHVMIDIPHLDHSFIYFVPEWLKPQVKLGSLVLVPFRSSFKVGCVVGFSSNSSISRPLELKEVLSDKPAFDENLKELCQWISQHYLCSFSGVLKLTFPPGINRRVSEEIYLVKGREEINKTLSANAHKQRKLINLISEAGDKTTFAKIKGKMKNSSLSESLKRLEEKGLVRRRFKLSKSKRKVKSPKKKPVLRSEKEIKNLQPPLWENTPRIILLQSLNKKRWDIYFRYISQVLREGRNALVLSPEIATTPFVRQLFSKFNSSAVLFHSGLSGTARWRLWEEIREGAYRIVVGTRTALFVPLKNLGLIIVDQEHDENYKEKRSPRYHAREVAIKRAMIEKTLVVLGSSAPSVESRYKAEIGTYELLSPPRKGTSPSIKLIDLKREWSKGNKSPFSLLLKEEMRRNLDKERKIVLFLNRRGFSPVLICRDCGWTAKCKKCSVSLAYHKERGYLLCHHCKYQEKAPRNCPHCGSFHFQYLGVGTQKIEKEAKKFFPDAKIIRIDTDSIIREKTEKKKLAEFGKEKKVILVGTQRILKTLDFSGVTLLAFVNADIGLSLPDFRSAEKTFQLFTEIINKAWGRSRLERIIIQSYIPENYAIRNLAKADYENFYSKELAIRKELCYPPFCSLINFYFAGAEEKKVEKCARDALGVLEADKSKEIIDLLGPTPAPLFKVKNNYRWQLGLKASNSLEIKHFVKERLPQLLPKQQQGISLAIDVDP